ncbi:PorP/SprF family type IX secretion system membrane protein [Xanthovirga aplysinae]|uniref:PorP/SprF family type IX secretion system membrane protein n=1 Tax=Xanthovirga aplysinae TaxID=2529853 RepID=UPI0012BBCC2D|nr:type IX secretion system membrane protein PorP/SprF [Xanthovirga aplysinae]MTI33322.1 type IX secretion system membrane protein PorP/SprF [Xanthovirga aplysinae]
MRKIKLLFALTAVILCGNKHSVYAQQDIQLSQYMFTTLSYNPAYAGVEGVTNFTGLHRSQWAGYNTNFDGAGGAPTTQLLLADAPILNISSGAGLSIINDRLGPWNNLRLDLNYAYHLSINNAKVSLGIKVGAFAQTIDFDRYRPIDPEDPLIQNGRATQIRPNMGLGAFLRTEKFYAGISYDHLMKSQFDFGVDELRNALEGNLFATAGYNYNISYNFTISPSFLFKSDFNSYSFDLTVLGTYEEKMWGGLGYRQSEAVIALLGYSFFKDNALKIGYSFDYVISGKQAKEWSSHEIMLKYTLPVATAGGKKIIRTPRFRH